MEPDPPVPGRPVMLANYQNPCWIYTDAELTGITGISAQVDPLPFVFHDPQQQAASPQQIPSLNGELQVRMDTCGAPVVATLPFETRGRPA